MSRYSFESNDDPFSTPPHPSRQQQPPLRINPVHPGAHPESSFDRLRAVRRHSREHNLSGAPLENYGAPISSVSPPVPPHRDPQGRHWGQELGYSNSMASNITPGADNYGEQAAGGIAGIALGVADANARESGLEAVRNIPSGYQQQQYHDPRMYESGDHMRSMPAAHQQPYKIGRAHV